MFMNVKLSTLFFFFCGIPHIFWNLIHELRSHRPMNFGIGIYMFPLNIEMCYSMALRACEWFTWEAYFD
ncbi:hypothetical protein KFK09_020822 [Dendrobium nobile]|uniref:Uncharacterized protein n=1 Tax=Dendrobium nobile TaxID=94219 RepID=A0A8T3ANH4_DENNO|nr:hypothetical protein KFK09_020822 [Dendrobium nobile]